MECLSLLEVRNTHVCHQQHSSNIVDVKEFGTLQMISVIDKPQHTTQTTIIPKIIDTDAMKAILLEKHFHNVRQKNTV